MANLQLKVGGRIYGGWTEISLQRGLEQLAGSFTLQLTERWPDQDTARPVKPGEACVVTIDDQPVITGFIDQVSVRFDAQARSLSVSGRDATADLVDCSASHGSGQWKRASLARIARDLCHDFKLPVVIDPAVQKQADDPFKSWNIEEGETVFDCLERMARLRMLLLTTRGDGALYITRPGTEEAQAALVEGNNLLGGEASFSWAQRFSLYRVKAQSRGRHAEQGRSSDAVVTRHRPLIVLAEDQAEGPTVQQRANWEKTIRAARANRATVDVVGWRQGDGLPLWQPNLRVNLKSGLLRADGDVLISEVSYTLGAGGERCALTLVDPRTFDRLEGKSTTPLKRGKSATAKPSSTAGQGTTQSNDWGQN
ncbi:phage baseplate assembly protein [Chitiniphilus shinanonensis]|uniref:phage baseplate assembly protein n=1 Tax=Chitiniphilus shinanonensis TaxID=553088 RepID=UPI0030453614